MQESVLTYIDISVFRVRGGESFGVQDLHKLGQTPDRAGEGEGCKQKVPRNQRVLQVETLLPAGHESLDGEGDQNIGDRDVD